MNALETIPTMILHGIVCKLEDHAAGVVATVKIGELATTPDAIRVELERRGHPGTSFKKARLSHN